MRFKPVRLGDWVRIQTGKLDVNQQDFNGIYPFFTCAQKETRINRYGYDCECVLVAGNGDLNVKYYKGKFEAYQRTYIIESVDSSILDVKYLYHFMCVYVAKLREMSIGGVIKYIKLGYLTDIDIPLPPLDEQKRIAAILDKADAIRRKRQQAMELADEFLRAVFLDMFGDPVTNPKGWDVAPCFQLADILTGYPFSSDNYCNDASQIRLCGGLIISPSGIDWPKTNYWPKTMTKGLDNYFLAAGDIILAMDRPWISSGLKIGMIDKSDEGALLVQRTARLRGKKVNQLFLYQHFKSESFKTHCKPTETTVPHISIKDIKNYTIILPPQEMQEHFAKIAKRTTTLMDSENLSAIDLEKLNLSLTNNLYHLK